MLLAASLVSAVGGSVVVFNEIMYHPPAREPALEWVELHNQMAVDVDLSGWSIGGGIRYEFSEGAVMPGNGYLVVAVSPADLIAASGLTNVLGPFAGRLSNAGDRLELRNRNERLMDEVNYGAEGDWPVGPDGSGVSLTKRDEDAASSPPENWTVSATVGGTPGRRNFAANPFELVNTTPVLMNGAWRFDDSGTNPGADWIQTAFDDRNWSSGQGLFQAGSAAPPLGDPQLVPTVFSSGVGLDGAVLAPGSADPHYLLTQSAQVLSPPPPAAASVILNHSAWFPNDSVSSWIGPVNPGTADVAAGNYNYRTSFTLEGFDPTTAKLTLKVGADNRLNSVRLNGASKSISYVGFATLSGDFTVTNGFVAGTNSLDFLTANDGPGSNPAGFRVNLSGTARKQFDIRTPLPTGPTTYYFRANFSLRSPPELATLKLNTVVADGAVFYLNGAEVLRLNLPAGVVNASTLALSNVLKPAFLGPFMLSTASLVTGTNVLAVEVHRGPGANPTLLLGADLALTATNILVPPPVTLAFNEVSSASQADFWIELINYGATPLDLAGCVLARQGGATNREHVFSPQTLAPGGFVQFTAARLGFGADPGDRLFLFGPGRRSVLDAVVARREPGGRWPDGTGSWWFPTTLTPGASNHFVFRDEVVINEILYHPPLSAGTNGFSVSWLELYNRSAHAVDLSGWRLAQEIAYDFPLGTTMPPGGYLVVAKDVGPLQSNYPGLSVLGPFTNSLRHRSSRLLLLDPAGNPADEVRYFDHKPWPEYADGGGSSLELRDPWADNAKAEAWAASVESGRSGWSNYTYHAVAANNLGPTQWNEFVIGLLDAGECLIDDLSVVENPAGSAVTMLQNGNFENGLKAWRVLGNHSSSRVEVDPDNAANHVLHLVATGPTDHLHNHLETTYTGNRAVANGRDYRVSYRARWLAGNNRLNTRLYFNRVARTTALPMPALPGTPGVPNSTLTANLGPTFAAFSHRPVVPNANEPVTISVNAGDPQGVSAVALKWSANGGTWKTTPMSARPAPGVPGYSNYAAVLPGQPAGTLVQFFAQAQDGLGAMSTYPAGGASSRALYKVDDGKPRLTQLHRLRLLLLAADAERLHAPTNVMSNDWLGLTAVYDEQQAFYDAGIHLQSSERGRNDSSRVGFTVRLPADQLFRGAENTFTIDRSGGYSGRGGRHDELLLWRAVNHAGGLPGLECDLVQCFAPRAREDSTGLLRVSAFEGDYFDSQFAHGADGNLYKLDLVYYPTTTVTGDPQAPKLPQPDNVVDVEFQDRGNDPENYRWIFLQENHADQDDYSQVIALNKAFSLSGSTLDTRTSALVDTDEYLRTLAFLAFIGAGDVFTYGLNHNWKVYFRPGDGKALGLLWDMDYNFVQPISYSFPGGGSANTARFVRLPNNYRRYYNHLLDISTTTVNAAYLGPWASRYGRLLGEDWSGAVTYLQQRADFIRRALPLTTPFVLTVNGGRDFATTNSSVALTGMAPLTVKNLEVNGSRLPVTWTSLTNWTLTVPLPNFKNLLVVQGVDNYGHFLTNATDSITVTNTGVLALEAVVINEWMADNSGPGGFLDPADGRYSDWLELYNPNLVPVDLSGYFLTDTLAQPDQWKLPPNTVIAAHGFLLVWADQATNWNSPDLTGALHAGFQLNKAGDVIGLFAPDGTPQHTVVFGPQYHNVSQGLFPDGRTNTAYFMANWTPRAANELNGPLPPQIASLSVQPDGALSFAISTIPGRTYRVEFKDELQASEWTLLGGYRVATSAQLGVADALDGRPHRFYRAVLVP